MKYCVFFGCILDLIILYISHPYKSLQIVKQKKKIFEQTLKVQNPDWSNYHTERSSIDTYWCPLTIYMLE